MYVRRERQRRRRLQIDTIHVGFQLKNSRMFSIPRLPSSFCTKLVFNVRALLDLERSLLITHIISISSRSINIPVTTTVTWGKKKDTGLAIKLGCRWTDFHDLITARGGGGAFGGLYIWCQINGTAIDFALDSISFGLSVCVLGRSTYSTMDDETCWIEYIAPPLLSLLILTENDNTW